MSGDKPQRSVTVSGQDFAKLMQIYQINYMFYSQASDYAMSEFRFFQYYADNNVNKSRSANSFVTSVVDKILTPYMSDITALSKAEVLGAKTISTWSAQSSIEGAVNPFPVTSYNDGSLYNLLRNTLDIGVFNELYVEDAEDGPILVVRPIPFKDGQGMFIQGTANNITLSSIDIVSQNVSRSDENVANYFWVTNSTAAMLDNSSILAAAIHGDKSSFVKFDGLNCGKDIFGIRKLEADTALDDEASISSDTPKEDDLTKRVGVDMLWVDRRRKLLADLNIDNAIFESGSFRLRGNENIKAGMYINILRGVNHLRVCEVYAHSVTHTFVPFSGFHTDVHFDRGTGFIERAQKKMPTYLNEIEAQGAV
jgi:hypothetical protein